MQIALELERMRRSIDVGFTKTDGSLALLVARSDRTEADIKQLRTDTETAVRALQAEVEALKRNRWPMASVVALAGIAASVVAFVALFRH